MKHLGKVYSFAIPWKSLCFNYELSFEYLLDIIMCFSVCIFNLLIKSFIIVKCLLMLFSTISIGKLKDYRKIFYYLFKFLLCCLSSLILFTFFFFIIYLTSSLRCVFISLYKESTFGLVHHCLSFIFYYFLLFSL